MANEKKALKGLKSAALFPIEINTEKEYKVGQKVAIPAAQELTKSDEKEEYEIFADDETYDTGSIYKYTTLELTTAELTPKLESLLTGGAFDEQNSVYTAKLTDEAPEFAFVYAALMSDGGYRMFRHPVVKLMSVKVDHQTKGSSNDIAAYTLTLRSMARKKDSVYREQKDVAKGGDLTWIDDISATPVTPGGGGT